MAKIGNLQIDTIKFSPGIASAMVQSSGTGSSTIIVPNPENKPIQLIFKGSASVTHTVSGSRSDSEGWVTRTRGGVVFYNYPYAPLTFTSGTRNFPYNGETIDVTAQANDEYTFNYVVRELSSTFPSGVNPSYQTSKLTGFYIKR